MKVQKRCCKQGNAKDWGCAGAVPGASFWGGILALKRSLACSSIDGVRQCLSS